MAIMTPKMVVSIKLAAMMTTNIIMKTLVKLPPAFNPCEVWIVDKRAKKLECEGSPIVCQMPEMAKNNSNGAKMQPRYKWIDRRFFIRRLPAHYPFGRFR